MDKVIFKLNSTTERFVRSARDFTCHTARTLNIVVVPINNYVARDLLKY